MVATDINLLDPHKQSLSSQVAVGAIKFYRKHLSHRKGFNCASGAMGLKTCSTIGLENFRNHGLWEAIQRQRQAFKTCREMFEIYSTATRNDPDEAMAIITQQHQKSEEDAIRLIQIAKLDKEEREQIKAELRKELRDEMKRNSKDQLNCCDTDTFACGGLGRIFGPVGKNTSKGACDIISCVPDAGGCDLEIFKCDVGGCDAGGCDVGGCSL